MNLIELDDRLEALIRYLKRQGGQAAVQGLTPWRTYKIADMVEAVTAARKRIMKEVEK
jgi:hypothetical protein